MHRLLQRFRQWFIKPPTPKQPYKPRRYSALQVVYRNNPHMLNGIETYRDAAEVAKRFQVNILNTKLGLLIHLYIENTLHDEISRRIVELTIESKPRKLKIFNIMREFDDIPTTSYLSELIQKEGAWLRK